MNSNQQSQLKETDNKNANRYAKIHVLFRELARTKGIGQEDLSRAGIKVKKFWKEFFGIGSLTELSDERLKEMENFVADRIKHERNFSRTKVRKETDKP